MKVCELIELLKAMNPEGLVTVYYDSFNWHVKAVTIADADEADGGAVIVAGEMFLATDDDKWDRTNKGG